MPSETSLYIDLLLTSGFYLIIGGLKERDGCIMGNPPYFLPDLPAHLNPFFNIFLLFCVLFISEHIGVFKNAQEKNMIDLTEPDGDSAIHE